MSTKDKAKHLAKAVAVSLAGASVLAAPVVAHAKPSMEKCYGIVKKGKNDCGGPGHSCAAQAKTSGSGQEWMYVLKGNCKRIVGGSLKAYKGKKSE